MLSEQSREKEGCGRDALRRINPAASSTKHGEGGEQDQSSWLPKHLHAGSIEMVDDMATRNSRPFPPRSEPVRRRPTPRFPSALPEPPEPSGWPSVRTRPLSCRLCAPLAVLILLSLALQVVPAFAEPPRPRDYQAHLARVQAAFDRAQERWRRESNSVEAAWTFGRSTFDWAEFATNDHQRSTLAELGIAACRRGVALEATNVAAHYYLGLNLGQLARTKLLGALKLIDEMEAQWTTAIRLDPHFDYGGPHRALGVLYRDAPGWPTSIGSQKKSRQNLEAALKLHPEYPGNVITWQEGLVEWGSKKTVRDRVSETESFLKKAREMFQGEAWAWDWDDWDQRWAAVKRKAGL